MSTGTDGPTVRLAVHLTPYHGTLDLDLEPEFSQNYFFSGRLRLTIGQQYLQCWQSFFGHNIHQFCAELDRLRLTLQGSARLLDWDFDELLCFSAVDRRGTIAVGGRFDAVSPDGSQFSETNFLASRANLLGSSSPGLRGFCSFFDGFTLDQSDLARAISAMRRFLTENDMMTENPDSPTFDWQRARAGKV